LSTLYSSKSVAEIQEQAIAVASFCADNAAQIDHHGKYPEQEFKQIAEAGLLVAPLQPNLGGIGLGIDAQMTHETLILLQQIGCGNLAVGRIFEGHINALQLIQTFGTAEQIERYAREVREQHKIFGVWNAEAGDGVKVIPLAPGQYRLEGSKTFCSGVGCVDRPFVNGRLPDGSWQMCIVPLDEVVTQIDSSWWQPSGMKATASYKIDFTGVVLNAESLIGKPNDYDRQPWLSGGAIRFAAVQLGGAEALFNTTRQYLTDLNRTHDPYQEMRLGQMTIAIESGRLWLKGAAEQFAQRSLFGGDPNEEQPKVGHLVVYANMVRTAIEQICLDTIQWSERSIGTRGLLPPYPMERIIRDLTLYLRQPAFDAVLADVGRYSLRQPLPASQLWSAKNG
jgi:alkylation response protein AidB-like acyl-CoA dehydrogenase